MSKYCFKLLQKLMNVTPRHNCGAQITQINPMSKLPNSDGLRREECNMGFFAKSCRTDIGALIAVTVAAMASAAHAQEPVTVKDGWTAMFNGQASREEQSGADPILNGSFGLQWQHDNFSLGANVGTSHSTVRLPSVVETVGTSAFDGGLSLGLAFGKSALEFDFGYSRQGLSGNVTAGAGMTSVQANTTLELSGSVLSTSTGGSFSHSFGGDALTFTPKIAVGYDRTKNSVRLAAPNRALPISSNQSSNGVSVTPELDVICVVSKKLSFRGSLSFTATTNGAASRLVARPMGSGFVQTGQQSNGAAQWGSFSLSAKFSPFHNIAIIPSFGTTMGRSTNEFFGGAALGISF